MSHSTQDDATAVVAEKEEEPTQPIRVLCFGDSLTEGLSGREAQFPYNPKFTPYATTLDALLKEKNENSFAVESGVSGEVTRHMIRRFEERLETQKSSGEEPFTHIAILGGTNDLGTFVDVDSVFFNLQKLYSMAMEYGAQLIVISVPENGLDDVDWLDQKIEQLNEQLLNWTEEHADHAIFFDLHNAIPYSKTNGRWYDHLHFSKLGYQMIGEMLFEKLNES